MLNWNHRSLNTDFAINMHITCAHLSINLSQPHRPPDTTHIVAHSSNTSPTQSSYPPEPKETTYSPNKLRYIISANPQSTKMATNQPIPIPETHTLLSRPTACLALEMTFLVLNLLFIIILLLISARQTITIRALLARLDKTEKLTKYMLHSALPKSSEGMRDEGNETLSGVLSGLSLERPVVYMLHLSTSTGAYEVLKVQLLGGEEAEEVADMLLDGSVDGMEETEKKSAELDESDKDDGEKAKDTEVKPVKSLTKTGKGDVAVVTEDNCPKCTSSHS
ncbi:hypothetical protein BT63DRAFT_426315 [Microthyrium microscopicum]|uniref:Uncharacterized protein n=1 Tax=Microthyrium microscopicum TaxID=703497 RepID=A0A6A6U714_9PEZI|nr:hypothetical protein BT63DRAFT_426315 [Microthyrium microscopicum]